MFGVVGKILRFNGGLFASPKALTLDKKALALLLEAAECNWADVEPAIFGTLLERALDPKERHALGAHYTPRAYVERLVGRPSRSRCAPTGTWCRPKSGRSSSRPSTPRPPRHEGQDRGSSAVVREFHQKLCHTRVLDPACGSGNFLYVTLDLFKRLEGEVLEPARIARRDADPASHGIRARHARAVPRHRGQTVGQGDRRAGPVDRLSAMALPHVREVHPPGPSPSCATTRTSSAATQCWPTTASPSWCATRRASRSPAGTARPRKQTRSPASRFPTNRARAGHKIQEPAQGGVARG